MVCRAVLLCTPDGLSPCTTTISFCPSFNLSTSLVWFKPTGRVTLVLLSLSLHASHSSLYQHTFVSTQQSILACFTLCALEAMSVLVTTMGGVMERNSAKGKQELARHFETIATLSEDKRLNSRMRFDLTPHLHTIHSLNMPPTRTLAMYATNS